MAVTNSIQYPDGNLKKSEAFSAILTQNEIMLSVLQQVESVAVSPEAVLITGETGVGKELIAQAIHALSGRKGRLVAVNVAGLDDNVFSDTLFGHDRGAYTGADRERKGQVETAAGGTLFLDEIGDLSPVSQVKLLRLLQEREYHRLGSDEPLYSDCRILTATNVDIWNMLRSNKFRSDLNFRLRTHHIHIPPLRERTDDIPLLVDHFIESAARSLNKPVPKTSKQLFVLLCSYPFPGNVRELQAMLFDAVSRHTSGVLALDVFQAHMSMVLERNIFRIPEKTAKSEQFVFPENLPTIKELTVRLVLEALERAGGNQTVAASMLGISRQALGKRLQKIHSIQE